VASIFDFSSFLAFAFFFGFAFFGFASSSDSSSSTSPDPSTSMPCERKDALISGIALTKALY
jgi:hypothetical protein